MKNLKIFLISLAITIVMNPFIWAGITWDEIYQFDGARVYQLVQSSSNPSTFYANVQDCGVWKSIDGGITWNSTGHVNTWNVSKGMAVSPADDNRIIFASQPNSGAESGFFLSTDGGLSWTNLVAQFSGEYPTWVTFANSDPDIVYAGSNSKIYRSSDGGASWSYQNENNPLSNNINDVKVDLNNPNRLIIAAQDQMAISNDGGVSWTTALFDYEIIFRGSAIDIVNDNFIVASNNQGILLSYDNGEVWSSAAVPGLETDNDYLLQNPGYFNLTVDRSNLSHILMSSYYFGVMESYDGGYSWQSFNDGLPSYFGTQAVLSVSSEYSRFIVSGYDSGLYVSENGNNWDRLDEDFHIGGGNLYASPLDESVLFHIIGGLGIFRSIDGGLNWENINNQIEAYHPSGWNVAFHPTDPGTIYFTTTRGVFRTFDNGDNWERCSNGLNDYDPFWQITIDPVQPEHIYIYGNYDIFRTSDGGDYWELISTEPNLHNAPTIDSDPFLSGHIIVSGGRNGRVYESYDYGDSWIEIFYYPDLWRVFNDVKFDPENQGVIYGASSDNYFGIWRSVDNGQNWEPWSQTFPEIGVREISFSSIVPERMYALTNHGGVYLSDDSGVNWVEENNGLENLSTYDILSISDNGSEQLFINTYSGLYNAPSALVGDYNNDLIVNVLDIVMLVNAILVPVESSDYELWAGDLNGDGLINVLDIVLVVNLIIGSN